MFHGGFNETNLFFVDFGASFYKLGQNLRTLTYDKAKTSYVLERREYIKKKMYLVFTGNPNSIPSMYSLHSTKSSGAFCWVNRICSGNQERNEL
jgi:hypothetical protein